MPYSIRKREGEHCLVKVNPDGSISQLGCHSSRGEAVDQQRAITASENSEKCGDGCDCEVCNRIYKSIAYAKFVSNTKCGCAGPGKLINLSDLKAHRKTKKR